MPDVNLDHSQAGVIGDRAHVEGGIHFHRQTIVYDRIKPVSAGDLLDACQAQVASMLEDARHKYDPALYVNRAIEQELNVFFESPLDGPGPNCFLIVAPAGSGKTNLLCDLARICVNRQPALLLMGGSTYISGTSGLFGSIKEELETASSEIAFRSAGDSLHTLHRLAEEIDRDALVFLDAVNEYDRPVAMRQAVADLLRKTRGRRIKLIITCRDYYWGLFKGRFWKGATVNSLPDEDDAEGDDAGAEEEGFSRFAAKEYKQALDLYMEHYDVRGRPVGDAAEQCRHPLLLRFFCEAYRGQEVGQVEDIRLKELFDRYWDQKLDSITDRMIKQGEERLQDGVAQEVGGYLLNVASYMLHNNVRAVQLGQMSQAAQRTEQYDDPRSIYGRIRDEFIILEERKREESQRQEYQVAFVYEEFMEYVMARSLICDWDRAGLGETAILREIESLTKRYETFAQILGVMVYLALMLKEQRQLDLWSLLLNKGERWQDVVFEAFRKLPEDQLDSGVSDALAQMLRTDNQEIQKEALDLLKLERIGKAASRSVAVVSLTSDLARSEEMPIARRAVLALGYMPSDVAVPMLVEALGHSKPPVQRNAATSLTRQGHSAVASLITALYNDDKEVRRRAAEVLEQLDDERAVEPFIAALSDGDSQVQWTAVKALGQLADGRAIPPLIDALGGKGGFVQEAVAQALGQMGEAALIPLIVALLRGRDNDMRYWAARALGYLGDVRAVDPLVAVLKDDDWKVRRAAAEVLGELGDARAVKPLVDALQGADADLRQKAARALGELGDVQGVSFLVAALLDPDRHARQEAAQALERMGDAAVPFLIRALENDDLWVKESAARVLGQIGDARAVEPLIAALKAGRDVRSSPLLSTQDDLLADALEVCQQARRASPPLLQRRLRIGYRRACRLIELLEEMGYVSPIVEKGETRNVFEVPIRGTAARALAQIGEPAVMPLVAALQDENETVRQLAAEALGQIGDARAVEPLVAVLKDPHEDVRWAVVRALGQIGDGRAAEPLVALLQDGICVEAIPEVIFAEDELLADAIAVFREAGQVSASLLQRRLRVGHPRAARLIEVMENTGYIGSISEKGRVRKVIQATIRSGAAAALVQIGEPAVTSLMAVLGDDDWEVRLEAIKALGQIGDARAVEPLVVAALTDGDSSVRQAAAQALGQFGDAAIEPLITVLEGGHWWDQRIVNLRNPNEAMRQTVIAILQQIGTPEALAAVQDYEGN